MTEFMPAPRFVAAQAWWVASELCRRRSRLRVLETWPMDGFYHGLEIGVPGEKCRVFMNFHGSIHLHDGDHEHQGIKWTELLEAPTPHTVVREIESRMGWLVTSADSTTPRSLTYRVLAACLTRRLNDRREWTVVDGSTQAGVDLWGTEPNLSFLDDFEGARTLIDRSAQDRGLSSLWLLREDERPAVLLSSRGRMYRHSGSEVDLMAVYRQHRDVDEVATAVLAGAGR